MNDRKGTNGAGGGNPVAGEFRAGSAALAGRTNAGKSTLLNRLIGQKIAIVSDRPQTTRSALRGVVNRDNAQIVLVDTPGIHKPLHRLNDRMMRAALDSIDAVDVVIAVADAAEPLGGGDRWFLDRLQQTGAPVLLALNKIDRLKRPALLPIMSRWAEAFPFAAIHPLSAMTGEGVDALLDSVVERLPVGPALFPEDQLTDASERFLAAEIVREKLILATRDELPHSTTVTIESWDDPESAEGATEGGVAPGIVRIDASILVERDSQKGIVIGKGGLLLKRIGTDARVEIEELIGRRVFLGLMVKVRANWRDDERLLDRLGLPS